MMKLLMHLVFGIFISSTLVINGAAQYRDHTQDRKPPEKSKEKEKESPKKDKGDNDRRDDKKDKKKPDDNR